VIRLLDILLSIFGLVVLFPFFIIISLFILLDSRGGIFYKQLRVGKNNSDFYLLKLRSMKTNSDKNGLLTIGTNDSRITRIGKFLRKYKIDELPQLINVLKGDMSMVGPRPEVRKYVELYSDEQKKVLNVKPGITDYASIEYRNENEIIAKSANPEEVYINEIMPAKLELNLKYISKRSVSSYLKIICKTIINVF